MYHWQTDLLVAELTSHFIKQLPKDNQTTKIKVFKKSQDFFCGAEAVVSQMSCFCFCQSNISLLKRVATALAFVPHNTILLVLRNTNKPEHFFHSSRMIANHSLLKNGLVLPIYELSTRLKDGACSLEIKLLVWCMNQQFSSFHFCAITAIVSLIF